MKTIGFISILALVLLTVSCEKDSTDTPKTKTELLTSKTWVYDEYFTNYNNANTLLVYKRGKSTNSLNLSLNQVKFNTDGTVNEINQTGQTLIGTWKFLNNETQTEVKNTAGTFTSTIITLTSDSYIWFDASTTSGLYAKMIPK